MIIATVIEYAGLGLFAAASIAEATTSVPVLQVGALGLVGFMVAQNYRQKAHLATTLGRRPCIAAGEKPDERRTRADGPPLNNQHAPATFNGEANGPRSPLPRKEPS